MSRASYFVVAVFLVQVLVKPEGVVGQDSVWDFILGNLPLKREPTDRVIRFQTTATTATTTTTTITTTTATPPSTADKAPQPKATRRVIVDISLNMGCQKPGENLYILTNSIMLRTTECQN